MKLMPVAEVQARILSGVEPLSAEMVSIYDAAGRVLAEALKANLPQPPFNASAMDGFAVRAADIGTLPAVLKVIGRSAALPGLWKPFAFSRVLPYHPEPTRSSFKKTRKPPVKTWSKSSKGLRSGSTSGHAATISRKATRFLPREQSFKAAT